MKYFRAVAGCARADYGYVQASDGYAPSCPADGSAMEQVSIRIETIDNNTQNFSIYKCPACEGYLAGGGKLLNLDDKQAAAKTINDMRKEMGRPLDVPYTASEIIEMIPEEES